MKRPLVKIIVFDFDGVLVESVAIKGEAFVELYKDESQEIQQQVLHYHETHGGINRFEKIRHYESLCGREANETQLQHLADRFSDIVEKRVINASWVPGALSFLKRYHSIVPMFIASATPQEELERIVKERGISPMFKNIYGAPLAKNEALESVIAEHKCDASSVLMIGDTMTDYNAAHKSGTQFIGRILPGEKSSPFPQGTTTIDDLTQLEDFIRLAP